MAAWRQVLPATGVLLVSLLTAATALAQEAYPGSREVHMIVPFAPGSTPDILTRYFAENMRPFLGGTIVVENKVGASGNIGIIYVAKAKPDSYTILSAAPGPGIASGPFLFKNPGYDPSEFAVLGGVCRYAFTVSVAANSPHKTLQSLIAAVRAKGANASYGTMAPSGQISGAMMKNILKLEAVEVPYRTSPDSLNDLNSGALDYVMYDLGFALPRHREGKLRVLAVASKERMTTAPDIPTMDESGVPGVDVTGWWGIEVPAGVLQPIKDKISSAFLKMAEKPETKKWLTESSYDPWVIGPAEAQAQLNKDIKKWAEWVKLANLQPKE
jgi:tripartite-type tricarboxylate transporter receptor subunit TctC